MESSETSELLTGIVIASDGGLVGTCRRGIALLDEGGEVRSWLHRPDIGPDNHRLNDAGTDPRGRLLAGTIKEEINADTAAPYAFDEDRGEMTLLLDGLAISNKLPAPRPTHSPNLKHQGT